MSSEEYREKRNQLGLTQAELAARLEVSLPTIKRRELGHASINREAELAIRALKPKS